MLDESNYSKTIQAKLLENILENNSGFMSQLSGDTFHHAYVSRCKTRQYPQ